MIRIHTDAVTDSNFDKSRLTWLEALNMVLGTTYRCHIVADGRF